MLGSGDHDRGSPRNSLAPRYNIREDTLYDSAKSSMRLHDRVERNLFSGANSLGVVVLFDWPSKGSLLGYLPDRSEATLIAPLLKKEAPRRVPLGLYFNVQGGVPVHWISWSSVETGSRLVTTA